MNRRSVAGPNWKIAYDGYLDFYHLPILHKNTIGGSLPNRALYDAYGPHQRVTFQNPALLALEDKPEAEWPTEDLLGGVWTIFPHVSIATFDAAGRSVLISQLFLGATPLESTTVRRSWWRRSRATKSALRPRRCSSNEGGGQHFHRTLARMLDTPL